MTEYNRENPFTTKITQRYLLNKKGSTKKTYHITLDLTGSNITYRAGDALAILPENLPEEVDIFLEALNKCGNEKITDPYSGNTLPLKDFLRTKVNFNRIPAILLKETGDRKLVVEDDKEARAQFIAKHDLVEFFQLYPINLPRQQLISYLPPLLPRFYSIASSPNVHPDTVDLLVATFSYKRGMKEKQGLGPHYLCHIAALDTTPIDAYLHPTSHFLLPQDPAIPIIMIGPGTGVAPYRSFLQEREAQNASGKNWLFFGERNQATDYYYESYFESLKKKDFLSLDLAFSRDQSEKCYVQHRLVEKGDEIWSLLSSGAYLYICGDARHMAKDVTCALHSIIETHGSQDGKSYLKSLRKEKRLLLDVY
ncbi:MAG: sulfite reductase [Chlamydiota bacterium]